MRNNCKLSEINKNNYEYVYIILATPVVFVLNVVYDSVSINFIRWMIWMKVLLVKNMKVIVAEGLK